jgi:signal transduction protein with GAF and PtsI domain
VCGELAASPLGAFLLIGLGVDSLSVGPGALAEIKKVIRSVEYQDARRGSETALRADSPESVARILSDELGKVLDLSKFAGPWSLPAPA